MKDINENLFYLIIFYTHPRCAS